MIEYYKKRKTTSNCLLFICFQTKKRFYLLYFSAMANEGFDSILELIRKPMQKGYIFFAR